MKKKRTKADYIVTTVAALVILYVVLALVTFGFLHPWMTDTERFLCTWDALCWRHVD